MKESVQKLMERRADLVRCLVPEIKFEVCSNKGLEWDKGTLGTRIFYVSFGVGSFCNQPQAQRVPVERIMDRVFSDHACGTSTLRDAELAP